MSDDAPKQTASEVALCDRIREWAERLGFEVYPEIDGWDMVLVPRGADPLSLDGARFRGDRQSVQAGQQVGIHAKLRANCEVLAQALPPTWDRGRYPHLPFVAAPNPGDGFKTIARRLGIGVIDADPARGQPKWARDKGYGGGADPRVAEWPTYVRGEDAVALTLPPFASRAISAGSPSPRQLSKWRVGALRFLAFARTTDTWTTADLKRFGVAPNWAERWGEMIESRQEVRRGRTVRVNVYRLTNKADVLPDAGYADVAAELAIADAAAKEPAA